MFTTFFKANQYPLLAFIITCSLWNKHFVNYRTLVNTFSMIFITPEVVRLLQPFLVQSHRHAHPPISIHTTTDSGSSPSSTPLDVIQSPQPLVTRLPFALHDNAPLPPLPPYSSVPPVRPPTPIPPLSVTRYCSPLVTQFNPCSTCGAAVDHFPGCELQTQGV